MEKLKQIPAAPKRLICFLLALICMLGLLPNTAFAAGPNTIVMEDCTHNGVYYESAALSTCWLHQMKFDFNGDTVMGFCADHGGGMGWSLEGHEWNNPREITDPTVKTMLAYFYAHSRGIFTDQARALGVDEVWSSDYTWTMNAWVQAVVWRYQENLFSDPVAACAEELLYVYNNLEHTNYTSIDDVVDGTTLRDRAQYILDLGAQGVWVDCKVYEYDYAGPGSAQHPAYDVQSIIIGDLTVTRERYQMTVKKVDATNPNLALPGARFLVQNANGTFSQEVVTGSDGTVTLTNLEASTYARRGWFLLKIPALLPKKGTGSPIYIQQYLYPALRRYFDGKPPARYRSCVLAYRHVYQRGRPERAYRDHDNIEVNMVTDIITLYLLPDDAPRRCAHYYCSAAGEVDCTEVYVVPASRFPEWLAAEQADDLKEDTLYETSEIWA